MAGFDYAKLAATAATLIEKFGRGLSLRRYNKTGGNAWDPITSIVDQSVTGIVRDYTVAELGALGIPAGDQLVILVGAAQPAIDQKVLDGSVEMEIISITTVKPGDTGLVHFVQVRK